MKHCTDIEIERRIAACFELRNHVHLQMMGPGNDPLHPATSPLSPEWADLGAQYDALADESDRLYAELNRREAIHA